MTTPVEPVVEQDNRSLWLHLVGMIDRPVSTFEAILKRRKWTTWALPLVILIITFTLVVVVQTPYTAELAREQAETQLAGMPEAQVEAARSMMQYTLSTPFLLGMGLLFGYITIIVAVLVQSAVFYFGSLVLGGSDTDFGAVFSMTNWSRLPMVLGYLVQMGIILISQDIFKYPGISFLVATGDIMADAGNPIYVLLANLDIFWLWHLLLATLGLSVVARMSRGKSAVLVIAYAILMLGIIIGWTMFSMSMAPTP